MTCLFDFFHLYVTRKRRWRYNLGQIRTGLEKTFGFSLFFSFIFLDFFDVIAFSVKYFKCWCFLV